MAVRSWVLLVCAGVLLLAACGGGRSLARSMHRVPEPTPAPAVVAPIPEEETAAPGENVAIVIARTVADSVDESLVREAFRRVVAQGERDFGLTPQRRVTIYVDPDRAIGLEDALGLSAKNAIHIRAGQARSMSSLLPLMMHEYTHVLQYQVGRLRPQWWVEGQADHQALRVRDPAAAERERRNLYRRLADDIRAGTAPNLATLRGNLAWDEYIRKAGAGKAYGWGNAAVAFIESRAGFEGVVRIMTDTSGPNTFSRFDELVEEVTGIPAAEFDAAVKAWVRAQAG